MPEQTVAAPTPMALLPMFLMVFMIYYFIVIRPQGKERNEHETMIKGLNKHDEVVTNGGIIGTVVNLKPDRITLRVGDNVRIEVERVAIAKRLKERSREGEPAATETKKS